MKKLPVVLLLGSVLIFAILLYPSLVLADVGPAGIPQLEYLFARVVCLTVPAAFVVLFIILLMAGFKFLTSGGEAKALQSASQTVTWGLLGILFLGLVWLILRLIEAFTGVEVTKFTLASLPGVAQFAGSCWSSPPVSITLPPPNSPANPSSTFGGSSRRDNPNALRGGGVPKGIRLTSYDKCDNPQSTIEALKTNLSRFPRGMPGGTRDDGRELVVDTFLVPKKIREREIRYPALSETLPILSFSQRVCSKGSIGGECVDPYTEHIRVYRKEEIFLYDIPSSRLKWYLFPSDIFKEFYGFYGDFATTYDYSEAMRLGDLITIAPKDGNVFGSVWIPMNPHSPTRLFPYIAICISPETIIFAVRKET